MMPDNPAFVQLAEDVKLIKDAMVGNELSGQPGIVAWHNRMKEDMYGVDAQGHEIESKKNTLPARVSDLEDDRKKFKWIVTGIVTLAVAIKFGISALVDKVFNK
jgi:hypothetical protein